MFSDELIRYAEERFEDRLPYFGSLQEEIREKMRECPENEQVLMKFLYGTMPIQDAGMYDFSLFHGFVTHSLMLREEMEWCRRLPEGLFLQYVLYPRINTEALEDCRPFFFRQLKERIRGLSVKEAALEINYWCAENGTYQSSDDRTASPMAFYRAGKGRCGEESTFAVTAFRSVGIPARQVYTPRWAHCDDNHAWVEIWAEDGWHFLGACEPEEILDKGWFTNASSRAMLVHGMTFSDFKAGEELLGKNGPCFYYNDTAVYARVKKYRIQVQDSLGRPAEGASVAAGILNMAEFYPAAHMTADEKGEVFLTAGLGDMLVSAWKDGCSCQAMVSVKDTDSCRLQLPASGARFSETDVWQDFQVKAPEDYPMHPASLTRSQKEKNRERLKLAGAMRQRRIQAYFREEAAEAYPGEREILREAAGNFEEIYRFLSRDASPWRSRLLHSLPVKDYRDAKAEILEDHLQAALPYAEDFCRKGQEEIFVRYVLCPRIRYEELTDYRRFLAGRFSPEEQERFRKHPESVWEYIESALSYEPEIDYGSLFASPEACLRLGRANEDSRRILFTAICRTFGIPARVNPVNKECEVWEDGDFRQISGLECGTADGQKPEAGVQEMDAGGQNPDAAAREAERGKARVILTAEDERQWKYFQTWTLGIWKDHEFVSLDYSDAAFHDGRLVLDLDPGFYQILTSRRLPNGSQLAGRYCFLAEDGKSAEIAMRLRSGDPKDQLVDLLVEDFPVRRLMGENAGEEVSVLELLKGKFSLMAFLAEGQEPTEHVLNEILEEQDMLRRLAPRILFLLSGKEAMENATLRKVLEAVPEICPVLTNFDEVAEPLARRMYVDPEKLPLLVAMGPDGRAFYACSGYNVGSVALIGKLAEVKQSLEG